MKVISYNLREGDECNVHWRPGTGRNQVAQLPLDLGGHVLELKELIQLLCFRLPSSVGGREICKSGEVGSSGTLG